MKRAGLSDEEVKISRELYGDNSLTEKKKEGFFQKLLENFGDPMIKILIVALMLNTVFVILHYAAGVGDTEWYETVGIAAAVLIAAVVSAFSEYKNENAFRKLQQEASQIRCKVYRNGDIKEIPIKDIVKGDCVLLQTGDKIPADGYITDGSINVDQAALNGESREILKSAAKEDHKPDKADLLDECSVFRGAVVCSGNALMQTETVGDNSMYGKIAGELQTDDDRPSPLKLRLTKLADGISEFGYIGGAAIAVVYLIQSIFFCQGGAGAYFTDTELFVNLFQDIVKAVMYAVIIIVMAVPEGLPLMIAIVSSMNMKKMLNDNVLVRRVNGIETAGSLNILFSDKTGTITKGKLEAVNFLDGLGNESKSIDGIKPKLADILCTAIRYNTESVVSENGGEIKIIGGNPTERAALAFVSSHEDKHKELKTVRTLPFDSAKKYSAAQVSGDIELTFVKGAPEIILRLCKYCYDGDGNKVPFDSSELDKSIDKLAEKAIRVLAVASADKEITDSGLSECDMTLIGVIGIRDEIRPESVAAIAEVQHAGVQTVMITGDRKETAVAIAKDAGLLKNDDDIVLTSSELAKMTDDEIRAAIPKIRVIARALPSDKSRLVRLSQELDLVVGMTGDGVNDSPALKKADVGFAMGSGTEVAKEAGDIVILDDNFNSIVKAILYGRTIFNNIRKFISFQLSINLSAVFVSFIMPLLHLSSPLSIIQILWVNLVMDTLAALAFGGEPALERYMLEKPKRRDESIISKEMKNRLAVSTAWIFIVSLFILTAQLIPSAPLWNFVRNDSVIKEDMLFFPYLSTFYFTFFIFSAVFNSLNVRSEKLNVFDHIGENRNYFLIMTLIVLIQIGLASFGGELMGCYGMNVKEWTAVVLISSTIIAVDIIRKLIMSKKTEQSDK